MARCESTAVPGGDMQALGKRVSAHAAGARAHVDTETCARIGARPFREPASSRTMVRNEAGRERAKAGEAISVVDGKPEVRGFSRTRKTVLHSFHPSRWEGPRLVLQRHDTTEHTKQAAGAILGRTRPLARTTRARCARLTSRWVPGRARELTRGKLRSRA